MVGAEGLERRNQIVSKQDIMLKTKDQLDDTCYFYFTSYVLNMFRTLMYPSSRAYDNSVELPHWSCVLGSMCVGVSVWLGWRGIRVAVFVLPVQGSWSTR